jgi:TIR domain
MSRQLDTKLGGLKMPTKQDLFISHATADKERYVLPLTDVLTNRGVTFWLDTFEIGWGDNFVIKINEGLRKSRFMLLCLSNNLNVAGKFCPVPKHTEKQQIPRSHGFRDPEVVRVGRTHLPVAYPRSDLTSLRYPSPPRLRITGRLMPV